MSTLQRLLRFAAHACFAAVAVPVAAQTVRSPEPCADTSSVSYRERVVLDLVYDGENRREMWLAIEMAGGTRTRCVVAKSSLPTADTSTYGVLRINALESGGYEIATSLAGARAPRQRCRNARAAITYRDTPIVWGVFLAQLIPKFVECVIEARGRLAGR
ncbi:MAG: hypothetical protein IT353_15450 [Gemmatimonadaceae bacterium]|nr:hypothetical protein [Gemmatimonadaceae bacterium]